MRERGFVQSLYELSNELADYRTPQFRDEHHQLIGSIDELRGRMTDVEMTSDWIAYVFELSAEILETGVEPSDMPPEFELTRRVLRFAAKHGTSEMPRFGEVIENISCPEAELRFARALAWHESGVEPTPKHKAGVVLFDAEDEPFAYQKSSGFSTAFVWRDAYFDTATGRRWLPAGSIVRPIYYHHDQDAGPHWRHTSSGLMGVRRPHVDDVAFVRFGTCTLPAELREPFLLRGVQQTEKLGENLSAAVELNEQTVADRVASLMRRREFELV